MEGPRLVLKATHSIRQERAQRDMSARLAELASAPVCRSVTGTEPEDQRALAADLTVRKNPGERRASREGDRGAVAGIDLRRHVRQA